MGLWCRGICETTNFLFGRFFIDGIGRLKEGDSVDLAHLFGCARKFRESRISDSSPTPDRKVSNVTSLFLVGSELTMEV